METLAGYEDICDIEYCLIFMITRTHIISCSLAIPVPVRRNLMSSLLASTVAEDGDSVASSDARSIPSMIFL